MILNNEEQRYFNSEGKDTDGFFYKFGPFTKKEAEDFINMIVKNHGNEILGQKIIQLKSNHLMPVVPPKALYVKVYVM